MKSIRVAVLALPLFIGLFAFADAAAAAKPAKPAGASRAVKSGKSGKSAKLAFAPNFKAPFPCGQQWTYSHHDGEVRRALDFIRTDGGSTGGTPNLASAAGTVHNLYQEGGAGNYVQIDHGDGWTTFYFHLSSFSVGDGSYVEQGQEIGITGSTGASSGPHIHYEQLYFGDGQDIQINGGGLGYPGEYYQEYITSDNGCGGTGGKSYVDTFDNATGYNDANMSDAQGTLFKGTNYVYCKVYGAEVRSGDSFNHWWLRTDLDETFPGKNGRNAYVSAYYLSRWGNDEAKDNNGNVIPDCP
ncbi:M23 family metallopeptidase [Pendulispora rubella]|uniref:M23 family metallopeptidase n=1 Tax=Pendulispora rubella TaxID=2741070 RepID=A0ABZ2L382_9BACT